MTDPAAHPIPPTETLRHEHKVVVLVVAAMEREAEAIDAGAPVDVERVGKMVDFTREFTDGCHHSKEELVLFPKLRECSPGADAPVTVMLYEHEQGRRHIRAIAEALRPASCGEAAATQVVAENLRAYAALLQSHIRKEDSVLFPMAERLLTADDRAHLAAEFERIEREETGAGVHEKYHALAHELGGEE